MHARDKIKEILGENYKSPNGAFGEKQNRGKLINRREDAARKRKERARANNKPEKANRTKRNGQEPIDPTELKRQQRRNLTGEMRLTPYEAVGSRLVAYLETGKSKHMQDIFELMEEYPKLRKYIKEKSKKALPKFDFKVYASRPLLDEEVGGKGYRHNEGMRNWTLSKSMTERVFKENENCYIMECKVSPEDVVIYLPAFSDLVERVIMEGLVDEPMNKNVIRECKVGQEIVLPAEKYNEGYIVEVIQ